jgi:hypothetical protein
MHSLLSFARSLVRDWFDDRGRRRRDARDVLFHARTTARGLLFNISGPLHVPKPISASQIRFHKAWSMPAGLLTDSVSRPRKSSQTVAGAFPRHSPHNWTKGSDVVYGIVRWTLPSH